MFETKYNFGLYSFTTKVTEITLLDNRMIAKGVNAIPFFLFFDKIDIAANLPQRKRSIISFDIVLH